MKDSKSSSELSSLMVDKNLGFLYHTSSQEIDELWQIKAGIPSLTIDLTK